MEIVCHGGIRKMVFRRAIYVDLHNHLLDILVSLGASIADSSHGVAEFFACERFGLLYIGAIWNARLS